MTNLEKEALKIANKYRGNVTEQDRVKWLAGEVTELARAIDAGNINDIRDEIGDCAFLLLHISSRYTKLGLAYLIGKAAIKMENRNSECP